MHIPDTFIPVYMPRGFYMFNKFQQIPNMISPVCAPAKSHASAANSCRQPHAQ